ncbi:hypothetical protein ACSSS7_008207 [Eimeria intestinalis]
MSGLSLTIRQQLRRTADYASPLSVVSRYLGGNEETPTLTSGAIASERWSRRPAVARKGAFGAGRERHRPADDGGREPWSQKSAVAREGAFTVRRGGWPAPPLSSYLMRRAARRRCGASVMRAGRERHRPADNGGREPWSRKHAGRRPGVFFIRAARERQRAADDGGREPLWGPAADLPGSGVSTWRLPEIGESADIASGSAAGALEYDVDRPCPHKGSREDGGTSEGRGAV